MFSWVALLVLIGIPLVEFVEIREKLERPTTSSSGRAQVSLNA